MWDIGLSFTWCDDVHSTSTEKVLLASLTACTRPHHPHRVRLVIDEPIEKFTGVAAAIKVSGLARKSASKGSESNEMISASAVELKRDHGGQCRWRPLQVVA